MPLIPSQQSSLSGRRTALMCQVFMPATSESSVGPWNRLVSRFHSRQLDSVPEWLTPSKRTVLPPSTKWLPSTWSVLAAARPGGVARPGGAEAPAAAGPARGAAGGWVEAQPSNTVEAQPSNTVEAQPSNTVEAQPSNTVE